MNKININGKTYVLKEEQSEETHKKDDYGNINCRGCQDTYNQKMDKDKLKIWNNIKIYSLVILVCIGFGFYVYYETQNDLEKEKSLDNTFNTNNYCSNSLELYDECLNYYSNPSLREIQYCRNKVELYIKDCEIRNNQKMKPTIETKKTFLRGEGSYIKIKVTYPINTFYNETIKLQQGENKYQGEDLIIMDLQQAKQLHKLLSKILKIKGSLK